MHTSININNQNHLPALVAFVQKTLNTSSSSAHYTNPCETLCFVYFQQLSVPIAPTGLQKKIMDLLLYGTSLNAEGGRRVAGCLQSYIMGALAARQAAAAGGGVVAQQ